jgi:hypothetical protein
MTWQLLENHHHNLHCCWLLLLLLTAAAAAAADCCCGVLSEVFPALELTTRHDDCSSPTRCISGCHRSHIHHRCQCPSPPPTPPAPAWAGPGSRRCCYSLHIQGLVPGGCAWVQLQLEFNYVAEGAGGGHPGHAQNLVRGALQGDAPAASHLRPNGAERVQPYRYMYSYSSQAQTLIQHVCLIQCYAHHHCNSPCCNMALQGGKWSSGGCAVGQVGLT